MQTLYSWADRAADVPSFLKRHLALIRDLDEKVVALQSEIEAQSKRKLASGALKTPGSKRQRTDGLNQYDVDSAITRLLSLADEKVTIAAQVYDFIDKHIKDLDNDLAALSQEIEADKNQLGLKGDETACGRLGVELKRGPKARVGKGAAAAAAADGEAPTKGRRKRKKEEDALQAHAPGEHEPLYCRCQQPSKGDMVACDNDECQYEWFHYECVGLKEAPPAGEPWYCPYCAPAKNAEKQ